jgi:type I restriction enzyme M protein
MLDSNKKKKIDDLRDLLVGVVPNPVDQVKQISIALVYKFMNDQDQANIELGGQAVYFVDYKEYKDGKEEIIKYSKYAWHNLMNSQLTTLARSNLYADMLSASELNPNLPSVFQHIFKGAFLSYRNPETLTLFLREIEKFDYNHDSEQLGDAFEYLLSILGSQGQAGQFRTPRHIIDFIVQIMKPTKQDTILEPACGTAGFLISAFAHIEAHEQLAISERSKVFENICGYDITPEMVKFALVNLYLHGDKNPHIYEYDTLTSVDRWGDKFSCILANPPFMTPKGGIKPHATFRITATKSEVLFVDYILEHLHLNGRAGIIVPEGIIFQTAKAYQELRKMLICGENGSGNLVAVISLPSGVFKPYSGVKTSILIIDKVRAKNNDKIMLVKINNDGFDLGDKRNPINKNDLPMALTVIEHYLQECAGANGGYAPAQAHSHAHVSVEQFEKDNVLLVEKTRLAENDYNLSFDRYKISDTVQTSSYLMVKLGDVCEFINGFAFKPTDWESTGIPIVRIQNLTGTSKIYNYTNKQDVPQKYVINKFDLLISWSASIGFYMWHMDKAYLNQHIFKVICSDCINKQYLYYLKDFIVCKIHEMTHGNTMQHITKSNFENIEIPLPPLEIQQQIVDEIEQYQKIIDGAKQVIEIMEDKIKATIAKVWNNKDEECY